jgi:hypothetical protein
VRTQDVLEQPNDLGWGEAGPRNGWNTTKGPAQNARLEKVRKLGSVLTDE